MCLSAVQLGLVATCTTKVTLQCHVSLHAWLDLDAKVCRHLCQPMLILLKCGALSKYGELAIHHILSQCGLDGPASFLFRNLFKRAAQQPKDRPGIYLIEDNRAGF